MDPFLQIFQNLGKSKKVYINQRVSSTRNVDFLSVSKMAWIKANKNTSINPSSIKIYAFFLFLFLFSLFHQIGGYSTLKRTHKT